MIKPDGVNRSLIGTIITRLEEKGYKIVAMKMQKLDRETASDHYREHAGKPFFEKLISFITSGPVVAMVVEGEDAVSGIRTMMGKTDPAASAPGTIRGDLGLTLSRNIVHGSDSLESAKKEISLFFDEGEITDYKLNNEVWTYEDS